jgi:Protein of unknown function (DUF3574)
MTDGGGAQFVRPVFRATVLLTMFLGTPAWGADPACPVPGQKPILLVKMYFSQDIRGGRHVSRRAWRSFLSGTVTPRFPAGLTVYDAHGQWQDIATHRVDHETTKVVEIAAEDTGAVRQGIADIAQAYRKTYDQDSVGIVTSQVCAKF